MNTEQPLTKKQRRELRKQEKQDQRNKEARKKTTGRIVMWVVLVLVIGGVVYGLTQLGSSDSTQPILVDEVSTQDHVKGNPDANVILIEYSDFQCPACRTYYSLVDQIAADYADQIELVYRNFPLRTLHPNAQIGAQAAEAAGLQDKFWEMYEQLFANQNEWAEQSDPTDMFATYAETIGLDVDQFKTDLTSTTVTDKVDADYRSGIAANVNATPTFFLNGVKMNNPRSLDEFKSAIDEALATADQPADNTNSADAQ